MTDYTDLITRLRGLPNAVENADSLRDEAAAAITALQAERDALIHDMERAQAALSDMATDNERLRALTSPPQTAG